MLGELVISGGEGVRVEVSAEQILLLFRCQDMEKLHEVSFVFPHLSHCHEFHF